MVYLSQRDPRWSSVRLGASQLTVGRYGCTTTCISMLSDYFGGFVRPDEIAKRAENYTKDGLVLWTKLELRKMRFEWREYQRNDAKIREALKDPNRAVILQVDDGAHWVVALRRTMLGLGNDYVCLDPWTGKKCDVLKTYRNITGAAFFNRK